MASKATDLPEGTDSIIDGAAGGSAGTGSSTSGASSSSGATDTSETASGSAGTAGSFAEKLKTQAGEIGSQTSAKVVELRGQATDQFFAFAAQGKDRATESLDGAAKLLGDAAGQIEEKLGGPAGAYARQAADAVASFSTTLRTKEIGDLMEDARGFVNRSPALAVGAAAAAGFLLARVIKAGSATLEGAAQSLDTSAKSGSSSSGKGSDNEKA